MLHINFKLIITKLSQVTAGVAKRQNHCLECSNPGTDPRNLGDYWFVAVILVYKANSDWETRHVNYMQSLNCPNDYSPLFVDSGSEASSWLVDQVLQRAVEPRDYLLLR